MSKFFNFKLYLQGLKKSRVAGIAILIVTTVLSALPSFLEMIIRSLDPYIESDGSKLFWAPQHTETFSNGLVLILLLAPILTLTTFRFLNKRNESDFYHAIPFTRPCVFFSYLTAVLTWLFMTVISTMVTIILFRLGSSGVSINLAAVLIQTGLYWLALTMITSVTALAMTVTGTGISNLFTFFTLFFTFRIVGWLFLVTVSYLAPLWVTDVGLGCILHLDYNLPLRLLGSPFSSIAVDGWLILYTVALTLLLLAAGCFFYTRRRSEMAGKSAPGRIWQHMLRCMACLPLLCGIVTLIITTDSNILLNTVILALAVLLLLTYYLYEIITTKRLKNCLSATPFLAVLLAFGILFGVGAYLTRSSVLLYTPDAEDIQSVEREYGYSYTLPTYEDVLTNSYASEDPAIKELVAARLKDGVKTIVNKGTRVYNNEFGNAEVRLKFRITSNAGITHGRYLTMSHEENEFYWSRLRADEEYKKLWLSMPSADQIESYSIEGYLRNYGPDGIHVYDSFDPSTSEELWKHMVEDYERFSEEEKTNFKLNPNPDDYRSYSRDFLQIRVTGYLDGQKFRAEYMISPELFPTAYQYVIDHVDEFRFYYMN